VTGFFVQDLYQVTDKLLLSAGVRYDDYELNDNRDQTFESDGFSPNVGVSYQLTESLSLNASYAEALRGRQTMETFLLDSRQNDPALKAEEAENAEIGFEYYHDALGFSGTFYKSRIDNAVNDQRIPVAGVPTWVVRNVGDIETEGFDLRVSYDWSQVQAGLSYSNFDSDLVSESGDLQLNAYDHGALGNTIGNTWTADLAYQFNDNLEFGWNGRVVEGVDNIRTSAGIVDKDGYVVHDIYAQWDISQYVNLTFTVKNLFDKYYLDHATNGSYEHIPGYEGIVGLAEPGRDLRLTLSVRL
jgi:hemoglobin/transferrin/lactoferrin receptor protein